LARIAVITSQPPFAEGGHLTMARMLRSALESAGHSADIILTPQNRFGRQASSYLATWLTDVGLTHDGRRIDQVITLRYPSYAVRHPAQVCWLNHRMREYYDLWGRFAATLSRRGRLKERVRRKLIHAVDRHLLTHHVKLLFVLSRTVQWRLDRWGRIPSRILYPPPPQRDYQCKEYGDYIFAVSRLTPLKRIDLLVQALALPQASNVRCVIAGEGEDEQRLRAIVESHGLSPRVRLIGRIDESELIEHLARCRAVCFTPYQEDYGFVTVEAFASGKPVITCSDSGGPAELVQDGVNGLVCAAQPEALARSLSRLMENEGMAATMGRAGGELAGSMSWRAAVEQLVIV
jgi:glycosyltransferase involved in cell wall biosynthesis